MNRSHKHPVGICSKINGGTSGDHLLLSGPSMAAIGGPAGPSMATKSAMDDPLGPVVAGDHLRRDMS